MAGGRAVETSPLTFVFRMTYYVHRGSGHTRVFSMYPWAAEPKHSYFKGGIDVSSANLYSMRLSVELLSLLATQQKWYHHLQQIQSLMPHITTYHCPTGGERLMSLVHKTRLHGRRGKGTAEPFSREKLRHAPQKEGG